MSDGALDVVILWHMHQPYYKSLRTGRMAMPWVRLHGTKDYLDMILLAQEFPKLHINMNWVPSLLDQIVEYASGQAADDLLDLSLISPETATEEQKTAILKTHFSANPQTMILPHRRYADLLAKRGTPSTDREWKRSVGRFSAQDLRDLQIFLNLAWIDPLLRQRDPFLDGLVHKGENFTEDEKTQLFERQRSILAQIIPAAAQAWHAGTIEVSVSPYCHPILPLLCDTHFARRARPDLPLPRNRFRHPEDAEAQIREALDRAEALFGQRPAGMWPSEGSVCDEIIPMLAKAGVRWIATDEEVLAKSLGMQGFSRDRHGNIVEGDSLYRAYGRAFGGGEVSLVFRDHSISDLIGFQFAGWEPEKAADALIARLEEAQRQLEKTPGRHAVSIILDGENCWEFYREDGVPFLRAFYQRLTAHPRLRSVTISQHLAKEGRQTPLPALHSGSWINHDFRVWIGHPEDNTSWNLLQEARQAYGNRLAADPPPDPDSAAKARQSLFIAEGSDWNWWYGDEHHSGNDEAFDELYREHLANVYRFLGLAPPSRLDSPIMLPRRMAAGLALPRAFVSPQIDGRATSYFEWFDAGVFEPSQSGGAMRQTAESLLGRIFFGFDLEKLYLRADRERSLRWSEPPVLEAALYIYGLSTFRVAVFGAGAALQARLWREAPGEGWIEAGTVEAAAESCLEIAIPLEDLGLRAGDMFGLQIELNEPQGEPERQPAQAPIHLVAPDRDFEAKMWAV